MDSGVETSSIEVERRRRWISLFAKSELQDLEKLFKQLEQQPQYEFIRRPETGMVMVKGRTGGVGAPFNLGEVTLSRCVVRLKTGTVGYGYCSDRSIRHAELAALFDALLQASDQRAELESKLVAPLLKAEQDRRTLQREKSMATKVDFFTMVRGEN